MLELIAKVRASTGIQDSNNMLCTALVNFFTRYEIEFSNNIESTGTFKRTLRSALQVLHGITSGDYIFGTSPDFSNRREDIVSATATSLDVILTAFRAFLIGKASEVIQEDSVETYESTDDNSSDESDSYG